MNTLKIVATFSLIFTFSVLQAQYEFLRNDTITVLSDGNPLANPWAGGINSGQLSRIDLDSDGDMDIFVFDRIGNRVLCFLNTDDTPGTISYEHSYDMNQYFPNLRNWTLLRDFNCDGKNDIFTNNSNGIRILENVSTGDTPEFELRTDLLSASYNLSGVPFDASVYCISVDVPSIVDFDNDGDMDIFSWTESSATVYYYHSNAVEIGDCDSLSFTCANRCYGEFSENSENSDINYGEDFTCDFNVIDPMSQEDASTDAVHTGGCLVSIDLDQNAIKDLISSDVTETVFLAMYMEENDEGLDAVVDTMQIFPEDQLNTLGVELRLFPCAYYEDIDNDGLKDFVASPNGTVDTEDNESMWYYKNNGQNDLPDFEFIQEDFLQDGMIDLGRNAYPVMVDYNVDGLMDIIVSNKEYNEQSDFHPSQLALFENTGTATEPEFTFVDDNYLDIPQYGIESTYPSFGDLDNDGDMDLILGEQGGKMHFFRNNAAAGETADWVLEMPSMNDFEGNAIDVGQFATPQLFDVNGDGLLDLIAGEKNGNVNYLENVGSAEEFAFEHLIDTIGDAVASNFLGINGYSVPFMWEDGSGNLQLLIGSEVGYINHYTNIENNLEGEFTLVDEIFGGIWEGTRAAACLYDLDNDGFQDILYGQIGGGLAFYNGLDTTIFVAEIPNDYSFSVFPNPTSGNLNIQFPEHDYFNKNIQLMDAMGRVVITEFQSRRNEFTLDLSEISDGLYFLVAEIGSTRIVKKVIVE